tara:strand:- start:205 stop:648 length:444 start_codon:yes stop_codon:yes gene_type:complete
MKYESVNNQIKSIFKSKKYSDVQITSITSYNDYEYGDDTYLLREVCKRGTGTTFVGIVYKNDNYLPEQLSLFSEKKTDDEYFVPSIIYQKSENCRYAFERELTKGVYFTKSLVQSAKLFEWLNYQNWMWSEYRPWKKPKIKSKKGVN